MPFGVALRVLPAALQASLGGVADGEGADGGAAAGAGGQLGRALPLVKVLVLVMAYVKLLVVKNGQLEDDVRILSGLKVWHDNAASVCVLGGRERERRAPNGMLHDSMACQQVSSHAVVERRRGNSPVFGYAGSV